ncbi:MAG: ABC transporter ATP-binding protein [Rhodanobacteraceae bacterium]
MSDAANVITLQNVRKVFQTDEIETHALSDVNLCVGHGEYVSISGPSGCGKTTLLSIMGLLDTATEGSYTLNDHDASALNAAARARIRNAEIGFIFQAFNLISGLTVEENVELPLTYRSAIGSAERRERVQEVLERVGMAHRMRHYPAQLSGGQQQRVAVARALVGKPAVLLADEPTGNLDSRSGDAVMALLDELHKGGATICIVTHDARYAELAQRKILLLDGRVVDEETFERLRYEDDERLDALIGQPLATGGNA